MTLYCPPKSICGKTKVQNLVDHSRHMDKVSTSEHSDIMRYR
jgi:hypothetical protein